MAPLIEFGNAKSSSMMGTSDTDDGVLVRVFSSILVSVACILALSLVLVLCACCRREKKKQEESKAAAGQEIGAKEGSGASGGGGGAVGGNVEADAKKQTGGGDTISATTAAKSGAPPTTPSPASSKGKKGKDDDDDSSIIVANEQMSVAIPTPKLMDLDEADMGLSTHFSIKTKADPSIKTAGPSSKSKKKNVSPAASMNMKPT